MTATSTPEPVAELVARLLEIGAHYSACDRQQTIYEAASTIATLTAERDAATARIAELEAETKRLHDQVSEVSREAVALRTQTERQLWELSNWQGKHDKAQDDNRKLGNLLIGSAEFSVSETERADAAEAALAAATALASKARGAALEESAKVAETMYVRDAFRFEFGNDVAARLRALAALGEADER